MLRRLSRRRLPLRSPKASVLGSSTKTLPGGSPRGETSHEPPGLPVASMKSGLAAMNRAETSSTWSIDLLATAADGSRTNSPSSDSSPITRMS